MKTRGGVLTLSQNIYLEFQELDMVIVASFTMKQHAFYFLGNFFQLLLSSLDFIF